MRFLREPFHERSRIPQRAIVVIDAKEQNYDRFLAFRRRDCSAMDARAHPSDAGRAEPFRQRQSADRSKHGAALLPVVRRAPDTT